MLHIGCHLSSSDGFLAMGNTALSIEADTFQFFTRNPRGSKAKAIDEADAKALLELMKVHRFPVILAHAPYTLNPCSATEKTREFARLTGKTVPEIQADGLNLAEAFAREHGVTVLLKGPATIVTDGRETWITDRGCPGMATAGSGDVLSGILAAVCAGDTPLPRAAASGAWLNGRAGEIAQSRMGDVSMTAGDTVQALPEALRELRKVSKLI